MAEYDIKETLDCKGMLCPMPIVKTSKKIKEMEIGDVLEMISTDPGAIPDMQAWSNQTGHELLVAKEEESLYHFVIRKTH
jgi:tRNA 2-thiouridine synthesizing protein A